MLVAQMMKVDSATSGFKIITILIVHIMTIMVTHMHAKAFVGSRGGGTILYKTFS